VEVVDTETGDLSLLNLYRNSATSGQTRQFGRLREKFEMLREFLWMLREKFGRLKEIDIEDKMKKRNSFRSSLTSRIIDNECHRHLYVVDITGSTLDGKKTPFLYIYR
jgi:hypothetical protein